MKNKKFSRIDKLPNGNAGDRIVNGCIVLEGGAFRGLYTTGVLDALMQFDINLQTVVGVSAGALNGLNYIGGHIGRSARINLGYRHDSRYVGLEAMKNNQGIIGFDFLFQGTQYFDPLNIKRVNDPNRELIAVATNCLNGEPIYFSKNAGCDIFKAVQASASMPYVSKMVEVDGIPCLDGGCSDKLGYEWALKQGFEKIILIRTRPRDYRKDEDRILVKQMTQRLYRDYPEFEQQLETMNARYNQQCDKAIELEEQGRIFTIAPEGPVDISRVESDMDKLAELYYTGYLDGLHNIQKVKEYLEIDSYDK